ncbi:MAG TPA: hypothetical protein VFN67_33395 [Polyangiales bacterium]|nr:hypothetical protein [Polyangiales bacterium]
MKLRSIALIFGLCACASIVATQTFEISTEVAMPSIPRVDLPAGTPAQTVSLTARFGSCSKTTLGNLDKLRANDHVDAADVWVVIRGVQLRSDASFSGIEKLSLELVTPDETVTICDRTLSESDQASSNIDCGFEHRVRAEQLCSTLAGDGAGVAEMTIELAIQTGDVTLTTLGATIKVDTELEADVSL